ncbi:MAG: AAA family ATPase [Candidatus Micrarchaeota archaeon]|nr:AAA family ATPase [Candidatus Micrarchaeota archaeon]
MPSFSEILSKPTVFADRNVLSPHYVPETLPFREKEIERIMVWLSPALKNERPRNIFIYGKTGTGKTCSVKHVLSKLSQHKSSAFSCYINCRMYNSRYRVIQKITKDLLPSLDSMGFGLAMLYEKMMHSVDFGDAQAGAESGGQAGKRLIVVLDEVDMVKDLDDLLYTLTRCNDELKRGSVSLIGISNKLSFKDQLGQRSKSSLCENEMVFAPYTANQLQSIIAQRAQIGFKPGVVEESAINLAAAITGQDVGDARYALKLLMKAGEIADEKGLSKITDKEVDEARRSVDRDVVFEAISTLPDHQQLVLLAVANLALDKGKNTRLAEAGEEDAQLLISGEVYEEYSKMCRRYRKPRRSARWYREYLNDLEMLGLITTIESGAGMRGRTRLIRIGYPASDVKKIVEKNFQIIESP